MGRAPQDTNLRRFILVHGQPVWCGAFVSLEVRPRGQSWVHRVSRRSGRIRWILDQVAEPMVRAVLAFPGFACEACAITTGGCCANIFGMSMTNMVITPFSKSRPD